MARIRTIKPQFWLNEELGTIPRDARLLYIGLWNLADDRGVFEWKPGRIKIQIFPYDPDVTTEIISEWLKNLENIHNIINFKEDGEDYGYIPKFSKHQDIKKPSKWTFTKTIPIVGEQLPTSTPLVPQQLPSSSTREKEKEKLKGIGKEVKESNTPLGNKVYAAFEKYAGCLITARIAEELIDAEQEYGPDIVVAAFQKASSNGKSGGYFMSYCKGIFEDYKLHGIPENRKNGGNHGTNYKADSRDLPKVYSDPAEVLAKRNLGRARAAGIQGTAPNTRVDNGSASSK